MNKIREEKISRAAICCALSFAGGFVFSGTSKGGIASFTDISLVGALRLPMAASAFAGAIIRCIVTDSVGSCIVKLFAMAIILIAKMFSEFFVKPVGSGFATAAAVVLAGSGISALIGDFPEKLLFYAFYGAISGVTAYSASSLITELSTAKIFDFKERRGYMTAVVYIVATASICSLQLPYINIGIILISTITLCAAYFLGGSGGVICGALGASGAFLASAEIGLTAAILPTAGLLAGFIGRKKLLITAFVYALSCLLLNILMVDSYSFEALAGVLCGVGSFLVIAPQLAEKRLFIHIGDNESYSDESAVQKKFLSDVLEAVRCDSGKISAALNALQRKDASANDYKNSICGVCYRRGICEASQWEISGELIPVVPDDCIRRKEAADEFERLFRLRTAQRLMKLRFSAERRFLSEQFRIISDIIRDTASGNGLHYSRSLAARIENALKLHKISFVRVMAGYTPNERITAEIYFASGEIGESSERICGILSDTLGVRLHSSASVSSVNEVKIGIYQPAQYDLQIHSASICAAGYGICGDSSAVFSDSTGVRYIVLSDGMGSGKNAAVDSHMVIGMFKRLVCSGMPPTSAVRIVNSVMVSKSREESFATLDCIMVSLDDCMLTSVKSGAAPTIIRRGSDVIKISSPVFPIGIIEEAELFVSEQKLSEGDIVIMFSDGITENAYLYIKELLLRDGDIRDIVTEITAKAEVFNPGVRADDVTVIGMKIVRS